MADEGLKGAEDGANFMPVDGNGAGVMAGQPTERNRAPRNTACRVYVSNLAWRTTWRGLKDHMRTVGEVAYADVFRDRETQRSRGCGVVEFLDEETAKRAIAEKNESELDGRQIFVREDRR